MHRFLTDPSNFFGMLLMGAASILAVTGFAGAHAWRGEVRVADSAVPCRLVPANPMAVMAEPGRAGRGTGAFETLVCDGPGAQGYVVR